MMDDIARRSETTLRQAALAYLNGAAERLKPLTLRLYTLKLADALDCLGPDRLLRDVTPNLLRDYIAARRSETSDIQIRKELTSLSSMLEFAADARLPGAPEANPCRMISKRGLAKPVEKPRWLQPDEVRALLEAARRSPFWTAFLGLLLETGMRHEEALGLTWGEVDFDRNLIVLDWKREKTARGRLIPLTGRAREILLAIPRRRGVPHVFVSRHGKRYVSIWKDWGRLRERAGAPHARIHDLRHTVASYMRQAGMARDDRKAIMGHSSTEAHELYSHGSVQSLAEALNAHRPMTLVGSAD